MLFKEKVNYKQPGGAGFAPHQDAAAYRFVDHHISVMVPIDPADVVTGCLEFAPGHARGALPSEPGGRLRDDVAAALAWEPVEVEPGDLVAFDSYTPHRSGTDDGDRPRAALFYLTYKRHRRGPPCRRTTRTKRPSSPVPTAESFGGERVRLSISDDFLGRPVERADDRSDR